MEDSELEVILKDLDTLPPDRVHSKYRTKFLNDLDYMTAVMTRKILKELNLYDKMIPSEIKNVYLKLKAGLEEASKEHKKFQNLNTFKHYV